MSKDSGNNISTTKSSVSSANQCSIEGSGLIPPAYQIYSQNCNSTASSCRENVNEIAINSPFQCTNLLEVIMQLENLADKDGYSNNMTLSAFRKLFYDSGNWNKAIDGAASTGLPPSWSSEKAAPLIEQMKSSQTPVINGQEVDIGHLLTGLDATNHEGSFSRAGIFRFRSNKEFATFVGDLGSVVEKYVDEEHNGWVSRDDTALSTYYHSLAGDVDMAGNADSYAMDFDANISLSQNMLNYYGDCNRSDNKRYTNFAKNIGLGALESGRFSKDNPEFRNDLRSEISTFAQAYQMRNGPVEGATSWGGYIHYRRVASWVLDYFIQDLVSKVSAEN